MVYKSRGHKRQRVRRKKRGVKRNYKSKAANTIVTIVRSSFSSLTEAVGVSMFTSNGKVYSLSQMASFSNMTALYDNYRIIQVKEEFIPQADPSTLGTNIPLLGLLVDHDDYSPPTTIARWMNDPRANIKPFTHKRSITFRPHLDADVGNLASAGIVKDKMWLDSDDATAAHYGLKWGLFNDGTTYNYKMYRRTTYTVEFRHPKSL